MINSSTEIPMNNQLGSTKLNKKPVKLTLFEFWCETKKKNWCQLPDVWTSSECLVASCASLGDGKSHRSVWLDVSGELWEEPNPVHGYPIYSMNIVYIHDQQGAIAYDFLSTACSVPRCSSVSYYIFFILLFVKLTLFTDLFQTLDRATEFQSFWRKTCSVMNS